MSIASWTSPPASALTFPISCVIRSVRSSLCSSTSRAKRNRISPRFGAGTSRQSSNAAKDVQAVVRWGRRRGVRVIPRSGGHSYAGYSTGGGVVVDLSTLSGVRVAGKTAVIGPGTRLFDVYAALASRGGTIPAGSCPTVGFGGLTLGGGVGLASRKLGTTSDNVVAMTVVAGDGRVLEVDATHHPDLFWALRGAGGRNFGIVTSFRVR